MTTPQSSEARIAELEEQVRMLEGQKLSLLELNRMLGGIIQDLMRSTPATLPKAIKTRVWWWDR